MSNAFVGIDISKASLDVSVVGENGAPLASFSVSNDHSGIDSLITRLAQFSVARVALEPSGGYENLVLAQLSAAQLPIHFVNAVRIRSFAVASGKFAKTDAIDARIIAQFALHFRNEPLRAQPTEQELLLADLATRRAQLVQMFVAERNRLEHPRAKTLLKDISSHIKDLEYRIARIDEQIDGLIKSHPTWRKAFEILDSMPGVGPVTARTLIAYMPELGTLTRQQTAALAGLAPLNWDSGQMRGKRHIRGGRKEVRSGIRMSVWSITQPTTRPNVFRDMYERLRAAGKSASVAMTAVSRKMLVIANAMLKNGTCWEDRTHTARIALA